MSQLLLNTGRREGAAAGGSPSLVPAVPPFPPQAVGQQCLTTLSLLPSTVIRGRSADNRKALLNSRCPLRGHRVYEVKDDNVAPFLLYAGPTSADLETLCRVSTKRRISVQDDSESIIVKYRSAGRSRCRRLPPWCLTAPPSPTDGKTIEHSNAKSLISTDFRLI